MAYGKRVALTDYVECDHVDLSKWCRQVTINSTDEQVDSSGFNASGTDEFIAGKRARSVTVDMMLENGVSGGPSQVLYPLHRDKSEFYFVWRKNVNAGVGPTNPEWRGIVTIPDWTEGATRGQLEATTLTFNSSPTQPLERYET